jgi:hypothetical protein
MFLRGSKLAQIGVTNECRSRPMRAPAPIFVIFTRNPDLTEARANQPVARASFLSLGLSRALLDQQAPASPSGRMA